MRKAFITIFMMADGEIVTLNGALHTSITQFPKASYNVIFFNISLTPVPHLKKKAKNDANTQPNTLVPPYPNIKSRQTGFVYFCGVSIRRVQSREFRRQRWVNGTNVYLSPKLVQSHSIGESISAFFLQNEKCETPTVFENNLTGNTFRIFIT